MNKKWFAMLLTACLLLGGCQLAGPEQAAQGEPITDILAGFIITEEYLDLYDAEGYIQDYLNGKETDPNDYNGRIYAAETVREEATSGTEKYYRTDYSFDQVEGIALLVYEGKIFREDETLHSTFAASGADEGIFDTNTKYSSTDEGEEWTCSGTIYVPMDGELLEYYVNPVYQDAQGRLYVVSGSGMRTSSEGSSSQSLTGERTVTKDGVEFTQKRNFSITVEGVELAEQVTILQMSEENRILDSRAYIPGQLPEELTPAAGCAYLLVEEKCAGGTHRTILEPGEEKLQIYCRGRRGTAFATGCRLIGGISDSLICIAYEDRRVYDKSTGRE